MKLVLAEKPSVAMSLSKVIGANQRGDGYMEGNGYLVSWCVGHLVELSQPEAYDEKYAKWRYDDLPILPEHWKYQVSASTKKQFGILKELMQRKDVESLVCATDAGREGELIFRLVYHQCGCKKPVERLWISSMEDSAIREGFQKLRPGTEYDALYEAALCRERADWIVGINATRLFSCLYGQTLNVGRVMTPTLAMVVMRDAAIRAFKPEPFYSAELKFRDFQAGGERMKEKAEAEKLVAECCQAGSAIITKVEQKEKSEKPPALFDLTSLQREANRQLGFTAQQTLDYTQALYEKKLVTYPRTDSRYLTDDMAPLVPELVSVIQQSFQIQPDVPAPVNAAQVINSKKVTDHHAIVPTKTAAGYDISSLPSGEQAILTMLAVRLICAVGTPCRYAETIVEAECAGQKFSTKGKTVTDMGWRRYAGKPVEDAEKNAEAGELPELSEGMILELADVDLKEGKTSPPKRFTEDLLLSAMESASSDEFPAGVERKGIGTPATRAAIIEKLVQKGFIERRGDKKTKYLCIIFCQLLSIDDYGIGGNQMKENWVYRRGDIYLANLGVPIGSKQGGVRPVVVLQNDVGNFYSPTITVAPLTTKIQKKRSQPTHYFLRKAKGLARSSMVLAEQLDTCDKTCVIRYLGKVSKGQMRGIDEAVKVQLGYYIPEQAEKKRQGKCRKEVNFDGG
ncbi:MAG: DNA topoisomerase III [Ruminococcaceae bacterium]|nr:DNA topoisomerase III [Oscillospiraceae bacterium]